MNAPNSLPAHAARGPWRMPILPGDYDTGPVSAAELTALDERRRLVDRGTPAARAVLARLLTPLADVARRCAQSRGGLIATRTVMGNEMLRRERAFWQWTAAEWVATIAPSSAAYTRRHFAQYGYPASSGRGIVRMAAYFLGEVSDQQAAGVGRDAIRAAQVAFGPERIGAEHERVRLVLAVGEGFSGATWIGVRNLLSVLALRARSPYLEDITPASLATVTRTALAAPNRKGYFLARLLAHALHGLGVIDAAAYQAIPACAPPKLNTNVLDIGGIAPEWLAWCDAWRQAAVDLAPGTRDNHYADAVATGRWLGRVHPEIASPAQWTAELAQEFVVYLCGAKIGDDGQATRQAVFAQQGRLGKPLGAARIDHRLQAMRRLFSDFQDRAHRVAGREPRRIALQFKPAAAFRTPRAVTRKIQPHPRDIDLSAWRKLMAAAAQLSAADLSGRAHYPLAYVRAAALLWVTAARRPNEIARLRVGCVRHDWDPTMLDDAGNPVTEDAQFTYLHIPLSKTHGPFWIPIPAFTGAAVEAWERTRPAGQPKLRDAKDGSEVDFLFCYRNRTMGRGWLSLVLIPLLCRKANIEGADALGRFTPHRGRSTIATLFLRAGVPLDDISSFLGHNNHDMVRWYARDDPQRQARAIRQADVLVRTMLGLYDPAAAAQGLPSVFFYLGYGADKRPRLCASPQHLACPHRLRCVQCAMFIDADEAEVLERKPGVLQLAVQVPMEPEDVALDQGDMARLDAILDARRGLAPPAVPAPAFHFNPRVGRTEQDAPGILALEERLATLRAELVKLARDQKDDRNRLVKALKQQIVQVEEQLAALRLQHPR